MTGPLDVQPISLRIPEPPVEDPLHAPICDGIFVTSTAEFADPTLSSAIMRAREESEGRPRRVGDSVAGAQVAFIGFNVLDLTPAVWFNQAARLCQVQLFRPAPAESTAQPTVVRHPRRARRPRPAKNPGLPAELAARIQRMGPTAVRVERTIVDELIDGYATYMRGARIRPVEEAGRVVGMRLARLAPNGLLAHLGFEQEDRIESINGFHLTGPEAALGAYARLRTARELKIGIRRGNQPMVLEVAIQ